MSPFHSVLTDLNGPFYTARLPTLLFCPDLQILFKNTDNLGLWPVCYDLLCQVSLLPLGHWILLPAHRWQPWSWALSAFSSETPNRSQLNSLALSISMHLQLSYDRTGWNSKSCAQLWPPLQQHKAADPSALAAMKQKEMNTGSQLDFPNRKL